MPIQDLTEKNFDEMIDQHELLVIDFCADWCQPCKSFEKIMLNIETDFPDVLFGRVNVEKEKKLADDFQVRSVPYVMIIRNRNALYAGEGVLTKKDLSEMLKKAQSLPVDVLKG